MKTIIQIAVAFTLLTGAVQGGRAAVKHYSFVDAVQEAMLFAGSRTEDQIADKVMQLAGDYQIPLDPEKVSVERLPYQINTSAVHRYREPAPRRLHPPLGLRYLRPRAPARGHASARRRAPRQEAAAPALAPRRLHAAARRAPRRSGPGWRGRDSAAPRSRPTRHRDTRDRSAHPG